jgi:hypothetical protein
MLIRISQRQCTRTSHNSIDYFVIKTMTFIVSLRSVSAILFHVLLVPVVQVQVLVARVPVIHQPGSPISIGFSRFEVSIAAQIG